MIDTVYIHWVDIDHDLSVISREQGKEECVGVFLVADVTFKLLSVVLRIACSRCALVVSWSR